MQSQQNTKQPTSNTTTANETDKENFSNELAFNERFYDTPIFIRGNIEKGFFATIGNHIISETKEQPGEIFDLLKTMNWNILLNIVTFMTKAVCNEIIKELTIADLSKAKAQTMEE